MKPGDALDPSLAACVTYVVQETGASSAFVAGLVGLLVIIGKHGIAWAVRKYGEQPPAPPAVS